MRLLFCGIFSGLFVVLLTILIVLAVKRKIDKSDGLKFLFLIVVPVLIVGVVLIPFAIKDYFTDDIPYTLVNDTFDVHITKDMKRTDYLVFEYPVYNKRLVQQETLEMVEVFTVADNKKFEKYLISVPYYAGTEVDGDGIRKFRFVISDYVWTLANNPNYRKKYTWYFEPRNVGNPDGDPIIFR